MDQLDYQLDSSEPDALNQIDLDHMVRFFSSQVNLFQVSEVKQQTYNQERLKFNLQIILNELRQQRQQVQGLKYLEQENRSLKQNVSESNQALRRLIEQVKSQTEYVKTQTDQIMVEQIEVKEKTEDNDRRLNQHQVQIQTQIEKQRSNERTHDQLNQEISQLGLNQSELKFSLEKTSDQLNAISSRTEHNSQEISLLKTQVNEVKSDMSEIRNQQQAVQQSVRNLEKKVQLVDENNGKLGEKIEGSNRRIEGHSGQIKDIFEMIKKTNEQIKQQEKQIQEKEKKISSLDTAFNLQNTENEKEFSLINSEIEKLKNQLKQVLKAISNQKPAPQKLYDDDLDELKKLIDSLKGQLDNCKGQVDGIKKQVDNLTGLFGSIKGDTDNHANQIQQLKNQLAKLGNFITREQLEKGIKEMKDFQIQWNQKIELFVNKEIESLKKLLNNLPKNNGVTEEQVQIYILEVLQKAADKQQTKKALLYLENLIQGLHQQPDEKPQGPAPPFTCQSLMWSAPRCAACFDSGEPGKCPTGCSHGFEKNNSKLNNMICCSQALKIQCEKNLPKLYATPKFVLRPMTAKSSNNTNMVKSFSKMQNSDQRNEKNLSVILNVDLDILPKSSNKSLDNNSKKKIFQYQEKKFMKNYEEMGKIQSLQEKQLKNQRLKNLEDNEI